MLKLYISLVAMMALCFTVSERVLFGMIHTIIPDSIRSDTVKQGEG